MAIGAFVQKATPPEVQKGRSRVRRGGKRKLTPLEVAVDDASRRSTSGVWEDAKGATLVGLYAFAHKLTYGVLPDELQDARLFTVASKLAARMVHVHFGDDWSRSVDFIRWTWEREKGRDAWARAQGVDRNRMSWKLQFSASFVTDYRAAPTRRRR